MRYLKYNEELKSTTYRNAADKLSRLGHHKRASELQEYSTTAMKKEQIENWKRHVDIYSKYGKIKVKITKSTSEEYVVNEEEVYFCFYPYLDVFESDTLFLDPKYPRNVQLNSLGNWEIIDTSVTLEMWIIPQTIEQFDRINEILQPEYKSFGFQTNSFTMTLNLEPNNFEFTKAKFYYDDGSYPSNVKVYVSDRPSAGRIKILLKKFFNDSSLEYPLAFRDDNKTMYRILLTKLLADRGISSECGITMEDFSEFISGISPNSFYQE